MAEWIRVADETALLDTLPADCHGRPLALFRLEDGIYALDDVCSHEYSRLSEGEVWEGQVYCPKHGSRFDIRTGAVQGLPATDPVRAWPVKVEEGGIWVLCS